MLTRVNKQLLKEPLMLFHRLVNGSDLHVIWASTDNMQYLEGNIVKRHII